MEIKSRFDHFNINVTDLGRSLEFYDKALGLKETDRKEAGDGSFILVYLGDGQTGFRLELTWLRDHAGAYEPPRHGLHLLRESRHGALFHQRSRRLLDRGAARKISGIPIRRHSAPPAEAAARETAQNRSACDPKGGGASKQTPMQNNTELQREADEAVRVMKAGGIILYPTDTVWGLGCDATNAEAVERIYKLKRSENKKSMLVLCASADMVVRYVNKAPGIAFEVMELATSPLTAILPGAAGVAENLIPEERTLGVRIPDHEFCRRILRGLGRPVVSTSANISGEATPAGLAEVSREIIDGVDFVVNPRFEGKPTKKASSIIAFGEGGEVKIIRE